jgi:hypothetical protein
MARLSLKSASNYLLVKNGFEVILCTSLEYIVVHNGLSLCILDHFS